MKSKFSLLIALACFAFIGTSAAKEKAQKEFNESWAVGSVESLSISNKYGEIKINNEGGNDVTIDVLVTVEAGTQSKATKMIELIDVKFSKSGGMVKAVTEINKNFKSAGDFSIDYTVNIPSDKNLVINNKFGNLFVNELTAKGEFNIKYGHMTANSIVGSTTNDIIVNLDYGKLHIEELSGAMVNSKYSKFLMGEVGDLQLNSKYSTYNIEELDNINVQSKYDNFSVEEVGSFKASTQYTSVKIEELSDQFISENGYGAIKIEEISDEFKLIKISNSYGGISLGIDSEASYEVDASCDYCNIVYDSERFSGDRFDKNHSKSIKGTIGSGGSAKVIVKSRYGSIKLK